MNPLKRLAGQTAIYGLSSIIGRFLNFLLTPLWAGAFTAEQFGIITEMYSYVAFFVALLMYGMETAFFRYATKKEASKEKAFSTGLISLFLLSYFLNPFLNGFITPTIQNMWFGFPL
ncbi:MAG: lipopolysaccharide biosynthesis protein [Flavobacteriales bacterium]